MGYRTELARELKAQLAFSPDDVRAGQIERLEALVPEIEPDRLYPCEYISYRVTLFRSSLHIGETVPGGPLRDDLLALLLEATRNSPTDAGERLRLDNAARRFGVSRSTLDRWRKDGLPARYSRGRKGGRFLTVRAETVERFVRRRPAAVRHAGRRPFRREECERILARARSLRREGVASRSAAARTIAKETGRSAKSISSLIRRREPVLFSTGRQPLTAAQRADLAERFRKGESLAALARDFHRSKSAARCAAQKTLVEDALETPLKVIHNPEFEAPGAEKDILGEEGLRTPPPAFRGKAPKAPPGLPPYLEELYRTPLISRDEEPRLFRKYNFIKWRMTRIQDELRGKGYSKSRIEAFHAHRAAAADLKNILVRSNLRLVVNVAKRHVGPLVTLFDLISEGNVCLLRAVECFDYARGARFATYTTWALTKHYARMVPQENYRLAAQITGQEEMIVALGDHRTNAADIEERIEHLSSVLSGAIARLRPRDRTIIEAHYGIGDRFDTPKTLEEIAALFGVTRERIRQIERRALDELRWFLGPDGDDAITA